MINVFAASLEDGRTNQLGASISVTIVGENEFWVHKSHVLCKDQRGEEGIQMKKGYVGLVFVLVGVLVGNIYFWNYHYGTAVESSYDAGFVQGQDVGYQLGHTDGNQSGYRYGFAAGNVSGYQGGYDRGLTVGYASGFSEGNETGFSLGYDTGVEDGAGRGYAIRDPTFNEAITFTTVDRTDEKAYSDNYTCVDFAAEFKENAFQAEYRCGFVYIEFVEGAHSVVCFDTTDRGLIFIEPQSDEVVILNMGEPYYDRTTYDPPDFDDTITRFVIIW